MKPMSGLAGDGGAGGRLLPAHWAGSSPAGPSLPVPLPHSGPRSPCGDVRSPPTFLLCSHALWGTRSASKPVQGQGREASWEQGCGDLGSAPRLLRPPDCAPSRRGGQLVLRPLSSAHWSRWAFGGTSQYTRDRLWLQGPTRVSWGPWGEAPGCTGEGRRCSGTASSGWVSGRP